MELGNYYSDKRNRRSVQLLIAVTLISVLLLLADRVHSNVLSIDQQIAKSDVKATLMANMHRQMLKISGLQFQLLHSKDRQQAKDFLQSIAQEIIAFNNDYSQFEQLADEQDDMILQRMKLNFQSWRDWTKTISNFAFLVSDQDMVNFLSMTSLSMAQLDNEEANQIASAEKL